MADDVRATGPLYDGTAYAALNRGIIAARDAVAAEGRRLTVAAFTGSIRDNHGRFAGSITTTSESRTYSTRGGRKTYTMPVVADRSTDTLVTTSLASYGPFLEGVGSRNETTRFKGYQGFRRAAQQLDGLAAGMADSALIPFVGEMNA